MYDVGTQPWLDALRDALNGDAGLAAAVRGWSVRLGLSFEAPGEPSYRVALDITNGECVDAIADDAAFESADLRISGPCDTWSGVLAGTVEPMRSILTKRLRVEGNELLLVRAMPAAKALIEAAKKLDARLPATVS